MPTNLPSTPSESTLTINNLYRYIKENELEHSNQFSILNDTQKISLAKKLIQKLLKANLDELTIIEHRRIGKKNLINLPISNFLVFLKEHVRNLISKKSIKQIILNTLTNINSKPSLREYLSTVNMCSDLLKMEEKIHISPDIFLAFGDFALRLANNENIIVLLAKISLKDRQNFEKLIHDYLDFATELELDYNSDSNVIDSITKQIREFKILTPFRDVSHDDPEISSFFDKIHKKFEEIGKLEANFAPGLQSDFPFNPTTSDTNVLNSNVYYQISDLSTSSSRGITNGTSAKNFFNTSEYLLGGGLGVLVLLAITGIAVWYKKFTTNNRSDIEANKNTAMTMKNLVPVSKSQELETDTKTIPTKTYNYISNENLNRVRDNSKNLKDSLNEFISLLTENRKRDAHSKTQSNNKNIIDVCEKNIGDKDYVLQILRKPNEMVSTLNERLEDKNHDNACLTYTDFKKYSKVMGETANVFKLMQNFYETTTGENNLRDALNKIYGFVEARRENFDSETLDKLNKMRASLDTLLSPIRGYLSTYNVADAIRKCELNAAPLVSHENFNNSDAMRVKFRQHHDNGKSSRCVYSMYTLSSTSSEEGSVTSGSSTCPILKKI
ncbi:MAG: hypothetical protein WAL30_05340 [Candidatus Aquirickettsiella sp.]